MAQLGFSPAIDVWLLPVAQGGTQMPVTASTLWADKQMFTFDQAQSMRVLALCGQGVVVDIFSIHNRSDSYSTVLVLIEALIFMDGGLFR